MKSTKPKSPAYSWAANRPYMLRTDENGAVVARVRPLYAGGPWRASFEARGPGATLQTQADAMAHVEQRYP